MKSIIEIEQRLGDLLGIHPNHRPLWCSHDSASRDIEVQFEVNIRWLRDKVYAFHLGSFGTIEVYFKDHDGDKRAALRVAVALSVIHFLERRRT